MSAAVECAGVQPYGAGRSRQATDLGASTSLDCPDVYTLVYSTVTFEWDPAKSAETFWRRGFDFTVAARVFEGPVLGIVDIRFDYGERRFIAIGIVDGTYLTVVYTDRDNGARRRIISAWTSNRKERRRYDQAYGSAQGR